MSELVREVRRRAFRALRSAGRGVLRQARSWLEPEDDTPWFDGAEAPREVEWRTRDPVLREHASRLIRDGVTRLPGAVAPGLCEEVIAAFRRYCESLPEAGRHRDGFGLHAPLRDFHLVSREALSVGLHPKALRLLDFLFGRRAVLCGSRFHEKGTARELRRDCQSLHTEPEGHCLGVWTALEDASAESGPLVYYPGGHRLHIDRLAIAASHPGACSRDLSEEYITRLRQECLRSGLQETRAETLCKGDMLLWHCRLPHGSSAALAPERTSYGMLFHYVPEGVRLHGAEAFFSASFPAVENPVRLESGRQVFDSGGARFDEGS